ncbi:8044_t:CDS:2 [Funneliformis caledonium]|uniref:8044_t:CDS:1 n=1 Tax=Funneliformis caledonium TaxID=1117310 RepID=A0A9N9DCV7_9GLOM|nr:8044_t:CDS:2 [Funneliformis caledonium]
MCTLFWTVDNHPKYKFVFAANRDEYLKRPTLLASWWNPNILSGLDLLASDQGTWLGINRYGKFAALTNYRDDHPPPKLLLSRGNIVRSILETEDPLHEQFESILNRSDKYSGFNLIASDLSLPIPTINYLANRGNIGIKELNKGEIYGLSNSRLENPWPKVAVGINEMQSILKESTNESDLVNRLFNLLSISVPYKPMTTSLLEKENYLNYSTFSIRIQKHDRGGSYATRTSTIILVDRDNNVLFVEKNLFDEDEKVISNDEGQWFRFKFGDLDINCAPNSAHDLQSTGI